ncbi:MAG: transposase zinc-binding domain-containing protein, partial [Thermoanaerobaculia bacterium]
LLVYEERFEPTHGYLRRFVEPAVYRYLDCGIFDQGVARIRCPECRHEFLVAFSCKLRALCPSCHQKRELLWDVPHRQVVFTIPKRLRLFFRYDRKLLGELAFCAWRALKLYFDISFDGAEVTPGAVGFLQASGELLNFHPHVHILMTDGGFRPDGSFHHLPRFNSRHLERLFRAEVLRRLMDKGLIEEVEPTSTQPSPEDPVDAFTRQARPSRAKLIRRVYEIDPLLCPFCGGEIGTRRRRRRGGAAASSGASLWADPLLHHRLRHRSGDPTEPQAAGPGARASGPRATARARAPRPDSLRLPLPRSAARAWFESNCKHGILAFQQRSALCNPLLGAR